MRKAYQLKQDNIDSLPYGEKVEPLSMRLNKYLSVAGYCSRREADRLIEQGRVTVDGEVAAVGAHIEGQQSVKVDDDIVVAQQKHVYIALNKPVGITCTLEQDIQGNIADFMDYKQRIFPIGRLDKDSSGLILLTSDGDIVNKILRAENDHDKEYVVQVNRDITPGFIKKMTNGVEITNTKTKKRTITKQCDVKLLDSRQFRITLTQGMNRQIRRMCSEQGYRVVSLRRERIMNISLSPLKSGQWRYLKEDELGELLAKIKDNVN